MSGISIYEIDDMVNHWLQTPAFSMLGTNYGNNLRDILQTPMLAGVANDIIRKMIIDIPILSTLPQNSINIYLVNTSFDTKSILIDIAGHEFIVGQ